MLEELHIMIDLETLSTRANAAILEVGYAVFETQGNGINESGVWKLSLQDQLHMGSSDQRAVDGDTLAWWVMQEEAARMNAFRSLPRIPPLSFLHEFQERIQWHNIQGVWSHGLGFDVPIVEDLHRQYQKLVPWHYKTPRDTRTLFWLAGMTSADMQPALLKHSAEHDAIAQALTVQMALKKLAGREVAAAHVEQFGWNA